MSTQTGVVEVTTAVALGGCLAATVSFVHAATVNGIGALLGYGGVGLAGELVAMLGLVSLVY